MLFRSIVSIINQEGIFYFRKVETLILKELCEKDNCIIACGGGVVESSTNRQILEQSTCIFLDASVEELFSRVKHDKKERPLVKSGYPLENQFHQFCELYKSRLKFYQNSADFTIHTEEKQIDTIVIEIKKIIKENFL